MIEEKYNVVKYNIENGTGILEDSQKNKYFFKRVIKKNIDHINMLKNEVEILSKLEKLKCVPKIIDYKFSEYDNYVIYELVDGYNLKELNLKNINGILSIFSQILSCIKIIHDIGIIHCDLKPSNIMICKNGNIKIIDFDVSISGNIINPLNYGTINYCSPEQLKNEKLYKQTDIYSLGIILYELINKKKPFKGDNKSIKINKIQNNYLKINDQQLNSIFEKSINSNINERYSDIKYFIDDIEFYLKKRIIGD